MTEKLSNADKKSALAKLNGWKKTTLIKHHNKAINTMLITLGIRGLEYNWFGKSVVRTCYCGVMFKRYNDDSMAMYF